MKLPYTNIPEEGPQIPSGEYQMLPEPPADEQPKKEPPAQMPGVDGRMALQWAFQYMNPEIFGQG